MTPHIAGSSRETAHRKVETVLRDVANYYAGRPLTYCMNPEVLAQPRPQREEWTMSETTLGRALLVGVDIGTTSVKAVLFDSQGRPLREASQEYPTPIRIQTGRSRMLRSGGKPLA